MIAAAPQAAQASQPQLADEFDEACERVRKVLQDHELTILGDFVVEANLVRAVNQGLRVQPADDALLRQARDALGMMDNCAKRGCSSGSDMELCADASQATYYAIAAINQRLGSKE